MQNVTSPSNRQYQYPLRKCKDARGHEIPGLWERNGRFYLQMRVPGKGSRKVPLVREDGQPVTCTSDAVKAKAKLVADKEKGTAPSPRCPPTLKAYVKHYLDWLETTSAKSPLTIKKERAALLGWVDFMGELRLNRIDRKQLNEYAVERSEEDEVSNRTINLDVLALNSLLKFAKDEGWLVGELVTENWKQLKHVTPKRSLLTLDQLQALCDEAQATDEGKPRYENGQLMADLFKFCAYSGARRQAALSAKWDQVDWDNKQLTLFTKYDKTVVVDFNEKLEEHLQGMFKRRQENNKWMFPSPRCRDNGVREYLANPTKTILEIRAAVGMDGFHLHDLRHFFISMCVMAGVDVLTVAKWVGHQDGGLLIGRVYGHLNPAHLRDSAAKVKFKQLSEAPVPGPTPPPVPNVDLSKLTAADLLALLQSKLGQAPLPTPAALTVAQGSVSSPNPSLSIVGGADESPEQLPEAIAASR